MVDVKEDLFSVKEDFFSQDLASHDLVRQAFLSGDYASTPLPALPLDEILDYAEYWKWIEGSTRRVVYYTRSYPAYLRLSVPSPEVCKKVKKVEITCSSYVRGFSRDRPCPNTPYWTWGELSISLTTPKGVEEIRRERVQTDCQAKEQWQVHRCSFGEDSKFASSLVPGKSEILFSFNAQFPGWINRAKDATIKVMFV